MKIPETYEEFLNLSLSEYKQICYQKQPKEVVSKIYSFYKKTKAEGKTLNTIEESKKMNKSLKEIFGVK